MIDEQHENCGETQPWTPCYLGQEHVLALYGPSKLLPIIESVKSALYLFIHLHRVS